MVKTDENGYYYYNPEFNRQTLWNTNIAFEIYNISGRKILTGILDSFQTINVESWDPGMYIIRFASQGSVIQHAQKIIIR